MNKALLLPLLLICQVMLAQTPVVSNLHYKYTEAFKSPKKEDVKYNWYNFNLESNVLLTTVQSPDMEDVMVKMHDKSPNPISQIIDRNIQAIILLYGNKKEFVLEQLAMFAVTGKLQPNEEEEDQVINGYKCHCYKSPQVATPADYSGMGGQIFNSLANATQIKIWITNDIAMNDTFNPYILGVLRGSQVNPKFSGVIVKIEKRLSYGDKTWTYTYELDNDKLHDKREPLVMPWNEPEPRTALVEAPVFNKNNSKATTCTGETYVDRHTRMKEFLEKTAGDKKVKTSWFNGQAILPCNFWRTF